LDIYKEKSFARANALPRVSIKSYRDVPREKEPKPLQNYFPQRYLTVLGCS